MVLDLKRVFACEGTYLPIDTELDMHDVDFMGGYPLKTPVKITGGISNKAGLVTLKVQLVYVFSAPCDRCGLPTERAVRLDVEKSLAPEIVGEDSDSIITVPDMKFDISDFAFAEVYASLPMKHLCSDGCKGICPSCGKNLNEGECGCSTREIDPRLAALADLLKDEK